MKRVIVLITLMSVIYNTALSQTNIKLVIKGSNQISNIEASDYSFKEILTTDYKDTVTLNFYHTNSIDAYLIGCYINDKKYWTQVWLDSGNISIYAHLDSNKLIVDTVLNSTFYYYEKEFTKGYSNLIKSKNRDIPQINKYFLKNIERNIDNPFSLWIGILYLAFNQNNKTNVYVLKEAFHNQGDKFSWFRDYNNVIEPMNSILSTDHIDISDFKFISNGNKTTVLNLNNSNYYLFDFWFLGCAPCRKEHKLIKQKLGDLQKNNIKVIGISTDRYSKEWEEYLSENKYSWDNYLETDTNKITQNLNINHFPNYILINNKGAIIGRYERISEILKEFKIDE